MRKKDPNSTNSTGVLPLYHPCAQTSGIIIYSDGRTNGKMNSKTKLPKIASWPGILDSDKGTRTKVVLARKIGKQGHGSSPEQNECSNPKSEENKSCLEFSFHENPSVQVLILRFGSSGPI